MGRRLVARGGAKAGRASGGPPPSDEVGLMPAPIGAGYDDSYSEYMTRRGTIVLPLTAAPNRRASAMCRSRKGAESTHEYDFRFGPVLMSMIFSSPQYS